MNIFFLLLAQAREEPAPVVGPVRGATTGIEAVRFCATDADVHDLCMAPCNTGFVFHRLASIKREIKCALRLAIDDANNTSLKFVFEFTGSFHAANERFVSPVRGATI